LQEFAAFSVHLKHHTYLPTVSPKSLIAAASEPAMTATTRAKDPFSINTDLTAPMPDTVMEQGRGRTQRK